MRQVSVNYRERKKESNLLRKKDILDQINIVDQFCILCVWALPLSLSFSLSPSLSHSLIPSPLHLFHTHTHTHYLFLPFSFSLSLSFSLTHHTCTCLSLSLFPSLSFTFTHAQTLTPFLSLFLSHTHSLSLSLFPCHAIDDLKFHILETEIKCACKKYSNSVINSSMNLERSCFFNGKNVNFHIPIYLM